ncbi:hypothetical protein M422DRAFT_147733, partial [Sphaerobolus stellatus SS14]
FTPTKAIRILITKLSTTASGAFLISNSPLKSTIPIQAPIIEQPPDLPLPNWNAAKVAVNPAEFTKEQLACIILELASEPTSAQVYLLTCDGTISQLQAQLIIQNMHLVKMNKALQMKEKVKEADVHLQLFPGGFGRVLTDNDFITLQEDAMGRKAAKDSQKRRKKVARENKQAILAEQKRQWGIIRQSNEAASAAYKVECATLKALGKKKRDWPKAPTCQKKP